MKTKLSALALAISAVMPAAQADDAATAKKQPETMIVQGVDGGDFKAGGEQLVPAYLDGQVAHGGLIEGQIGRTNCSPFGGWATLSWRRQFETDDPGDDQPQAEQTPPVG